MYKRLVSSLTDNVFVTENRDCEKGPDACYAQAAYKIDIDGHYHRNGECDYRRDEEIASPGEIPQRADRG